MDNQPDREQPSGGGVVCAPPPPLPPPQDARPADDDLEAILRFIDEGCPNCGDL